MRFSVPITPPRVVRTLNIIIISIAVFNVMNFWPHLPKTQPSIGKEVLKLRPQTGSGSGWRMRMGQDKVRV